MLIFYLFPVLNVAIKRQAVAQMVESLHYELKGRRFHLQCDLWNLSLT